MLLQSCGADYTNIDPVLSNFQKIVDGTSATGRVVIAVPDVCVVAVSRTQWVAAKL